MQQEKYIVRNDPLWTNSIIQKMINRLMYSGKKVIAERVVYQAMSHIQLKTGKNPVDVLLESIDLIKPYVEVRSIRVAGSNYMVPVEIQSHRQLSLALRWLIENARKRKERGMYLKLAGEILDTYSKTSASLKKKEELHKMAEANRAFSHYRW
jgi:small subunit ribosomal protein S7